MGTIHVLYRTEIWGQGAGTRVKSWESKFQAAMQPHVLPISDSDHIIWYFKLWGAWFQSRPLPVYGFRGSMYYPLLKITHTWIRSTMAHVSGFRIQKILRIWSQDFKEQKLLDYLFSTSIKVTTGRPSHTNAFITLYWISLNETDWSYDHRAQRTGSFAGPWCGQLVAHV